MTTRSGSAAGLSRVARIAALGCLGVSGACLTAILTLGAVDAVATNAIGRPLPSTLEMSEVLLATAVFAALPYAQWHATHVKVDLLTSRLGLAAHTALEALTEAIMFVVLMLLFVQGVDLAAQSFAIRETASAYLPFPVYPAKVVAATALGLTTAVSAVRLARICGGAFGRGRAQ